MFGGFCRRQAFDRYAELLTDEPCQVAERDAFFSDPVIASDSLAVFEGEPEQTNRVKPMYRAPPDSPITDIGGDHLLPRGLHQE
jgi:hypothetical protein